MVDKNEIRRKFELSGLSIADWARQNNFSPDLVYSVLKSKHIPVRGESHKIAVKLGLKDRLIAPDFNFEKMDETKWWKMNYDQIKKDPSFWNLPVTICSLTTICYKFNFY